MDTPALTHWKILLGAVVLASVMACAPAPPAKVAPPANPSTEPTRPSREETHESTREGEPTRRPRPTRPAEEADPADRPPPGASADRPGRPERPPRPTRRPRPSPPAGAVQFTNTRGGPPGSTASVDVQAQPNAQCSIAFAIAAGPQVLPGLEDKQADGEGKVSWSWTVPYLETGLGRVSVTCDGQRNSTTLTLR